MTTKETATSSSFLPIGALDQPDCSSFIAALTLEGIRVSGQKVLQLVAVGVDIVDGFSFDSKLVALLHLSGAAGGSLVLTNQQIHIWKKGHACIYILQQPLNANQMSKNSFCTSPKPVVIFNVTV